VLNCSPISLTKETTIRYIEKEYRAKLKIIIPYKNNYTDLKICKLCHKITYNNSLKLILTLYSLHRISNIFSYLELKVRAERAILTSLNFYRNQAIMPARIFPWAANFLVTTGLPHVWTKYKKNYSLFSLVSLRNGRHNTLKYVATLFSHLIFDSIFTENLTIRCCRRRRFINDIVIKYHKYK